MSLLVVWCCCSFSLIVVRCCGVWLALFESVVVVHVCWLCVAVVIWSLRNSRLQLVVFVLLCLFVAECCSLFFFVFVVIARWAFRLCLIVVFGVDVVV